MRGDRTGLLGQAGLIQPGRGDPVEQAACARIELTVTIPVPPIPARKMLYSPWILAGGATSASFGGGVWKAAFPVAAAADLASLDRAPAR